MINTYGASARRIAALAGLMTVLGPTTALAAEEGSVGERKEAAYHEILYDRLGRGEIVYTEPDAPLQQAGLTAVTEPFSQEGLGCFGPDQAGPLPDGEIRNATLMLMSLYQPEDGGDPFSYFGTGTVIHADHGLNRVLTAAHVANPTTLTGDGGEANLVSVYAFDGEGRLVALLDPILANSNRIRGGHITHELLHEDVMVLSPSRFPSEEMAQSWQGRGVEVAPVQATTTLMFYGEGGNSLIAPGYSGAALLDPEGRAVGLITEIVPVLNSERPAPNTMMPEAVLTEDNGTGHLLSPDARALLEDVAEGGPIGVIMDAVAGGPPLSSPRVLAALGVDVGRITRSQTLDTDRLFSAGFPGRECRTSWLTYAPRPEVPFLDHTGQHEARVPVTPLVYTAVPGVLRELGPDGAVRDPAPDAGKGFGLSDFLSAMDHLNRGLGNPESVKNPFETERDDPDFEGPR